MRFSEIIAAVILQLALASPAPSAPPKAALEAKGRTPPLELRLEVADREVPVGSRIHLRISIRNIGKNSVEIKDNAFNDPDALAQNRAGKEKAYVIVLGPDGADAFFEEKRFCHGPPIDVPERQIRKLTPDEEFEEFLEKMEKKALLPRRLLAPGMSIVTPEWAAPLWGASCVKIAQKPRPGFSELWNVTLREPGVYRIKAVYDTRMSKEGRAYFESLNNSFPVVPKARKTAAYPFEHFVETTWITVMAK